MDEFKDMPVPTLRLPTDPAPVEPAAQDAPAAQAAQAAPAAQATEAAPAAQAAEAAPADPALTLDALTEEERKAVLELAGRIDVANSQVVLGYGSQAQEHLSTFSDKVLQEVRAKDAGEAGELLSQLVAQIQGFDATEEKKGLFGFLRRGQQSVAELKARYDRVEDGVERIVSALRAHQEQLNADVAMLEEMYGLNRQYLRELTLYIVAGEERLRALREQELPGLLARARQTGDALDAQRANDYAAALDRFEKKLHDLRLSRMVAVQMGPQVRLMQSNDALLAEKIQSTIVNTIPLWKGQMVVALGMAHAQGALKAQQAVTDVTNELLRRNAEMLKTGTVQTAQAAERGVIDLDTLRQANAALIETIGEVQRVQREGATAREQAGRELDRLERELRDRLLAAR